MLKTACLITGDNYNSVAADTPASKKKIIAMSLAIMVPTMVWLFNGFMLSYQVLKTGIAWALLVSFICALFVFIIEKLIIMANGNGWLTFFRICIGLIIALLGSIAIDEVVFKSDIDFSIASIKEDVIKDAKNNTAITFANLNGITNLEKDINSAQLRFDYADSIATVESDGSGGSGHVGIGDIVKFKDQKASNRKHELNELLVQRQKLTTMKESAVKESGQKAALDFNEHTLLIRIKALFKLIKEDTYMMTIYILFTALMFFFEFLVVILKLTWEKSNYEYKLEMIEEIGMKRRAFLQKDNSPLLDPGNYSSTYKSSREFIKPDSIFN